MVVSFPPGPGREAVLTMREVGHIVGQVLIIIAIVMMIIMTIFTDVMLIMMTMIIMVAIAKILTYPSSHVMLMTMTMIIIIVIVITKTLHRENFYHIRIVDWRHSMLRPSLEV